MSALVLVTCLLMVAVPGLLASAALYGPGEIGTPTRLALTFVLGSLVAATLAFLLALLGALSKPAFFVLLGVSTAALAVVALKRGRPNEFVKASKQEFSSDRWALFAGLAVLLGIAVLRLTFSPLLHFSYSAPWRYWADAMQVVDVGQIPNIVLQYGVPLAPATNKVLVSTLGAGLTFVAGREPLPGMAAALWISSVGLAAALWSFGRELGLRLTAALIPPLVMANRLVLNGETTTDLNALRAEILGRMVVFCALALAVRAIRTRRWKDAVIAGGLLGAAAGFHAVPVLIAVIFLTIYSLASALLASDRLAVLIRSVALVGVAAFVGSLILFLPRGDIAAGGVTTVEAPRTFDPTRYLNSGDVVAPGPDAWRMAPGRVAASYLKSALGISTDTRLPSWLRFGLPILAFGAAVAMLIWFPADLRPIGIAAWGLAAVVAAAAWILSIRYRLYIPAFFGIRRLFDYSSIPVILLGVTLLEGGLRLIRKNSLFGNVGPTVLVLVVAAVLIPTARVPGGVPAQNRSVVEAFGWIRTHLPCDVRLLPSVHSEGAFEALTGRVAVLEGATPYLRPGVREQVIRLLLGARRFFKDPEANVSFLQRHQIDYVIRVKAGGIGYHGVVGTANTRRLARSSFLRLAYTSRAMDVYQVVGVRSPRAFPGPESFPGYGCLQRPITL